MASALKVLIDSINAQLSTLSMNNFKVYDEENPGFFIEGIYYNEEKDELYFKCEEDKMNG